jgi:DNA primase catalytic subunit
MKNKWNNVCRELKKINVKDIDNFLDENDIVLEDELNNNMRKHRVFDDEDTINFRRSPRVPRKVHASRSTDRQ